MRYLILIIQWLQLLFLINLLTFILSDWIYALKSLMITHATYTLFGEGEVLRHTCNSILWENKRQIKLKILASSAFFMVIFMLSTLNSLNIMSFYTESINFIDFWFTV